MVVIFVVYDQSYRSYLIQKHQDTVIHLTCDNDYETLQSVLEWGNNRTAGLKDEIYGIDWEDPKKPKDSLEDGLQDEETPADANKTQSSMVEKRNPIMIAAQQEFTACTYLLYQYGYRIPQIKFKEGEDKEERVGLHERTRSKSKNAKARKQK